MQRESPRDAQGGYFVGTAKIATAVTRQLGNHPRQRRLFELQDAARPIVVLRTEGGGRPNALRPATHPHAGVDPIPRLRPPHEMRLHRALKHR
ncbi:hypothetical protein D3C77_651310 [compost metagenome]